ncbi:MAG: MarR family transcriptional regulator [Fimbriimonadaceae bacterium]|nr:MarR family transcriptional regulator [Alphaproteobacteria bacterium]
MNGTDKKTGKRISKIKRGKRPGPPYSDLWSRPGYLVRRLHQIHVGLFTEECKSFDITAIQYGLLTVLYSGNALDQVTLATEVGIDRTSGADVMRRLERRGLLVRIPSEEDRRAKLVQITDEGKALVRKMQSSMERAQERLIEPLTAKEQEEFNRLLQKIIAANNSASRAPMSQAFTSFD